MSRSGGRSYNLGGVSVKGPGPAGVRSRSSGKRLGGLDLNNSSVAAI